MSNYYFKEIYGSKNISQKFRLKIVGVAGTYFIEETNQIDLMSKKQKKFVQL